MARTPTLPWLVLALSACGGDPSTTVEYVVPADGQTAIPLDMPLLVHAPSLDVPPDYAAPDAVRVVDLADGGFVDGALVRDGAAWWFEPDGGWEADRRYAWTVDPPVSVAHGPQFHTSDDLAGSLVFDTRESVAAIAAATGDAGQPCVVLSGPVSRADLVDARLTVDDTIVEEPAFEELDASVWAPDLPLRPAQDPGLAVACAHGAEAGAFLRLWLGDDGPWLVEIAADDPATVVAALHRRSP